MLTEKFLLDDFHLAGKKMGEFETAIKEIDQHTYHMVMPMRDLIVVSLIDNQYQPVLPAIAEARVLPAGNAWVHGSRDTEIPAESFEVIDVLPEKKIASVDDSKLLRELLYKNRTMLGHKINNAMTLYHLSFMALPTLAQRLGITSAAIDRRCLASDMLIAELLNNPKACTLIIKHFKGIGKVVAVMSDSYAKIKLHELCTVANDLSEECHDGQSTCGGKRLGKMVCEGWDITHERSSIAFSFPEFAAEVSEMYNLKQTMTPCVELLTSDMGECAFTAKAYWRMEDGSRIAGDIYRKEHRKVKAARVNHSDEGIDIEQVEKEIREKIFDKYTILPERLMELMSIDISPSSLDLTKTRAISTNRKCIMAAFSYVFKKLRLVDVITKKRLVNIERMIDYQIIDETMHYTAYDVVMDIFSLDEKLRDFLKEEDLCKETLRKFNETISKAAYVDFDKMPEPKVKVAGNA